MRVLWSILAVALSMTAVRAADVTSTNTSSSIDNQQALQVNNTSAVSGAANTDYYVRLVATPTGGGAAIVLNSGSKVKTNGSGAASAIYSSNGSGLAKGTQYSIKATLHATLDDANSGAAPLGPGATQNHTTAQ